MFRRRPAEHAHPRPSRVLGSRPLSIQRPLRAFHGFSRVFRTKRTASPDRPEKTVLLYLRNYGQTDGAPCSRDDLSRLKEQRMLPPGTPHVFCKDAGNTKAQSSAAPERLCALGSAAGLIERAQQHNRERIRPSAPERWRFSPSRRCGAAEALSAHAAHHAERPHAQWSRPADAPFATPLPWRRAERARRPCSAA